jgi:hypothetical protein
MIQFFRFQCELIDIKLPKAGPDQLLAFVWLKYLLDGEEQEIRAP